MKLKVCTRKGKPFFNRAGFSFGSQPIVVEVTDEVAKMLEGEAMLTTSAPDELEEVDFEDIELADEPIIPEIQKPEVKPEVKQEVKKTTFPINKKKK